jgi:cyclase
MAGLTVNLGACCAIAWGCIASPAAWAHPVLHMTMPDWSKTPVVDHDLGHGVHMLESFGGNIGVLAGARGVLLVDAEYPQLHAKVLAAVRKISREPVRYLVNTHWHWDHVGGNGLFGKAGVVIFSSAQTRRYIVAAQKRGNRPGTEYAPDPLAIPVVTLGNGMKIEFHLDHQTIEVMHVPPAHTDGDLIVRYVEADVIQTGDTFFHGFYPDIDGAHGGTIDGMIAFYDTLYKMCDANTKIIPGHGLVANRDDVREYQAMLREVRNRVAKAIAAGMTEQQLIAAHPLDDLDRKWGGNLIKQPYLLGIVYEELKKDGGSKPNSSPRT